MTDISEAIFELYYDQLTMPDGPAFLASRPKLHKYTMPAYHIFVTLCTPSGDYWSENGQNILVAGQTRQLFQVVYHDARTVSVRGKSGYLAAIADQASVGTAAQVVTDDSRFRILEVDRSGCLFAFQVESDAMLLRVDAMKIRHDADADARNPSTHFRMLPASMPEILSSTWKLQNVQVEDDGAFSKSGGPPGWATGADASWAYLPYPATEFVVRIGDVVSDRGHRRVGLTRRPAETEYGFQFDRCFLHIHRDSEVDYPLPGNNWGKVPAAVGDILTLRLETGPQQLPKVRAYKNHEHPAFHEWDAPSAQLYPMIFFSHKGSSLKL